MWTSAAFSPCHQVRTRLQMSERHTPLSTASVLAPCTGSSARATTVPAGISSVLLLHFTNAYLHTTLIVHVQASVFATCSAV